MLFFQLDLSDNPLLCDCHIAWLKKWSEASHKLSNSAKTRCVQPQSLNNLPIAKVALKEFQCGGIKDDANTQVFLSPSNDQVVFEGDELSFHCRTSIPGQQWLVNESLIQSSEDLKITQIGSSSVLQIKSLKSSFHGFFTCMASDGSRASTNVLILPNNSPICHPIMLDTSRGTYHWSSTVAGQSQHQSCEKTSNERIQNSLASLQCRQTGEWAASVNVSRCPFTSDFTDTLHKFASMNTSFTRSTLFQSAAHLLNYTANAHAKFGNPMDVVFFSKSVEKYLPYLSQSSEDVLASYMISMIANVLPVSPELLNEAQMHGLACRRLLNVLENITTVMPAAFRHQIDTIAIETFAIHPVPPRFSEGITCSWYESPKYSVQKRIFHCEPGNQTSPNQYFARSDKKLLASLTVPATFYNSIDYQLLSTSAGYRSSSVMTNAQLMFATFANASLFPSGEGDQQSIGHVIGCKLFGSQLKPNMSGPITITLTQHNALNQAVAAPAVWDEYANGGQGSWVSRPCLVQQVEERGDSRIIRFSCAKLGYYSLVKDNVDPYVYLSDLNTGKSHHPILYIGTLISSILIFSTLLVVLSKFPVIDMAKELKTCLVNAWTCSLLAMYLYTLGIYETSFTCKIVAISLHLFSVSCYVWIFCGVYVIYTKVSNQEGQENQGLASEMNTLFRNHNQELIESEGKNKIDRTEPLSSCLRFYLLAYGLPSFIVAITAASNVNNYTSSTFCFISAEKSIAPFVGGFIVPLAFISTVMIGFALSVMCVLTTSPYRVKERRQDATVNITCEKKFAALDRLQTPRQLLMSQIVTYFLLTLALISTGFLRQEANEESNMSILLAIIYSLAVISYGGYIFCYFCLFRRDTLGMKCFKNLKSNVQSDQHHMDGSPDENEDSPAAENLVELCVARPNFEQRRLGHSLDIGGLAVGQQPKTSSPANSHIPMHAQDITVSPLVNIGATQLGDAAYSVVPLDYKPKVEMSLASVNTGINYTDSSTIKVGAPCDMAPSSSSLIGTGTPRRLMGPTTSSSLPRSLRNTSRTSRPRHLQNLRDEEIMDETRSKFSVASSTRSGHSKASSRRRHKKPNRRRPRNHSSQNKTREKAEPVYHNVNEDNDYMGDDDQFDSLDRFGQLAMNNELPSVIHEADVDDQDQVDGLSLGREEPASLEELPSLAELAKRETSV